MNADLKNNLQYESLDSKILKSPLLFAAEMVLLIGAVLSVLSLSLTFDADRISLLFTDLAERKQITDPQAQIMWFVIIFFVKLLMTVFSVSLAVGLALVSIPMNLNNKIKMCGFSIIAKTNRVIVWLWYFVSAVAGAVFIYRLAKYSISLVQNLQDFLFPLLAVISGEIVMLLVAAVIVMLCVKFSKEMTDLSYQSYYMLRTGSTESHIDPFCYIMFFAIAAISAYLAYFFFYDILSLLSFGVLAIAFLLLGISVKLFKKEVEWIKYRNYKAKKTEETLSGAKR